MASDMAETSFVVSLRRVYVVSISGLARSDCYLINQCPFEAVRESIDYLLTLSTLVTEMMIQRSRSGKMIAQSSYRSPCFSLIAVAKFMPDIPHIPHDDA